MCLVTIFTDRVSYSKAGQYPCLAALYTNVRGKVEIFAENTTVLNIQAYLVSGLSKVGCAPFRPVFRSCPDQWRCLPLRFCPPSVSLAVTSPWNAGSFVCSSVFVFCGMPLTRLKEPR